MTKPFPFQKTVCRFLFFFMAVLAALPSAKAGSFDDWFIAVKNDQAGKVKELLKKGFDPNAIEPKRGDTGLILAMRENSMDVMAVLLSDKRTKIDTEAFNGDNALMIACYNANEKAVKTLLDKGAKVNKNGWAPLHYAAASGNNQIVRMLLEKDAFIDAVSPNATTPIMMAARNGHIYTVKLLHDNGADLTLKNQRGYSAIDFANENKNTDIAKGLEYRLKKEADLEKRKNVLPQFPF
ncbi:ankyrin repeat domain-containing protein [Oxalobacter paraformigenes]|uniref:Ankyrin repeat domain-containing protein n=1 Tax=Oxalobacter paraformigenes TaxID=556268 RepID=C3X2Q5_9BURK|nr:ankyrin repeat domain-containing protein [Oxalobacter paraformigenes]EEO27491.1 hypothetical protein OFAG_00644 [Oxalobacter paraformigenes]